MKQMKECENSCKYYVDFKDNDYYYIIMEKCDGDLTDFFKRYNNGLPEYLIKKILIQLNKAFKMMNDKNIIHRDLKPNNIFIKYNSEDTNDFTLKIGDYGLSREYDGKNFSTNAGTPIFMAPEQTKSNYDPSKCDLWAIGVIIYMLKFVSVPYSDFYGGRIPNMLKFVSVPYTDFYGGRIPKKFDDYNLNDLVNKLIVVDPTKRISWQYYFNHPYFK